MFIVTQCRAAASCQTKPVRGALGTFMNVKSETSVSTLSKDTKLCTAAVQIAPLLWDTDVSAQYKSVLQTQMGVLQIHIRLMCLGDVLLSYHSQQAELSVRVAL